MALLKRAAKVIFALLTGLRRPWGSCQVVGASSSIVQIDINEDNDATTTTITTTTYPSVRGASLSLSSTDEDGEDQEHQSIISSSSFNKSKLLLRRRSPYHIRPLPLSQSHEYDDDSADDISTSTASTITSSNEEESAAVFADIWEPYHSDIDVPVFWQGGTRKGDMEDGDIVSRCFHQSEDNIRYTNNMHKMTTRKRRRARAITLMVHPIKRASFTRDKSVVEENPMVRELVNKEHGDLTQNDLEQAKSILSRKVLLGLESHMEESLERFAMFFHWNDSSSDSGNDGISKCIHGQQNQGDQFGVILEDRELEVKHKWDILLYDYAVHLFDKQALLFRHHDDEEGEDIRDVDDDENIKAQDVISTI